MRLIETDTLSNQNIATAVSVGSYTADRARQIFFRLFATQIAGSGSYTAYVKIDRSGAGTIYEGQPHTTAVVASLVTSVVLTTIPIPVNTDDVISVWLQGVAGDTTTPDITVETWEANYTRPIVATQFDMLIDSSGQITVGALAASVLAAILAGVATEVDRLFSAIAAAFANVTGVNRASTVNVVQADTWAESLTITPFVWATGDVLIVTLKDPLSYKQSVSDADSVLQWRFTNGGTNVLSYIKKAPAAGGDILLGTLTVTDDDNGVIMVNLDESISRRVQGEFVFDVKHYIDATDSMVTLGGGVWVVEPTVTYSIT